MNDIAKTKSFEEKMKDRVKDSIGDLMTDEDLKKIVEKGIEEVFFQGKLSQDGYSSKRSDPLINTMIEGLLKQKIEQALYKYIESRSDDIDKKMNDVIKNGAGHAFISALDSMFSNSLDTLKFDIQNEIQQKTGQQY